MSTWIEEPLVVEVVEAERPEESEHPDGTGVVAEVGSLGPLSRRTGIALLAAVVANLALLGVALAVLGGGFEPFAVVPVAVATTIPVLAGTALYAALDRVTARPNRSFTSIATVVLLLSGATLNLAFTLPGATAATVAVLGVMHVVAYAVAVVVITDRRPLA
jgi:hypothetical protein